MLGELAVLYLFLGGAGAGCVAACSLIDLLWLREPFGATTAYGPDPAVEPARRAVALGFALGLGVLVAGVACLAFDLGRIDRVLALFLMPQPTVMSVGAFALAALVAVAAPLAAVRLLYLPALGRPAVTALEVLAVALGLVVMVYTGLLLQSLQGAGLWRSVWLPVLFALSSASCGVALTLACCPWVGDDAALRRLTRALMRVDGVLIAAEAVAAALFAGLAAASAHPGAALAADALLTGSQAAAWWLGFGLCGLGLPLAVEATCLLGRGRSAPRGIVLAPATLPAVAAVLVLVGGVCLRWAVTDAAVPRELALQDPAAATELALTDDAASRAPGLAPAPADPAVVASAASHGSARAAAPRAASPLGASAPPLAAHDEREGLIAP